MTVSYRVSLPQKNHTKGQNRAIILFYLPMVVAHFHNVLFKQEAYKNHRGVIMTILCLKMHK